ncbi:hypothetical protein ACJIZ3_002020 [Penstemon smallii]|uniref:C2H2-type domain-containing protein n=1 Tax=Penstemon smallii TaxID=265156 RepID=A0ABD3U6F0_9LAMI
MAEVQEQRYYICKICNKKCVSGKSLGGHMRIHLAQISVSKKAEEITLHREIKLEYGENSKSISNSTIPSQLSQEKIENCNINSDFIDGYELRENPKKSWRISDPKNGFSSKGFSCKECGKEFLTLRAVSGHMRSHSIKNLKGVHQCKECGKGFDSIRAMFGHMKTHSKRSRVNDEITSTSILQLEDLCPVRKKRSRIRYNNKITPNPSFSSLNESTNSVVSEAKEVELAAKSLIMLSRGVKDWIGLDSVTESSDDDSVYFGSESSCRSKKIEANMSLFSTETEKNVSQFDDVNKMKGNSSLVDMMDTSLLSVNESDSISLESSKSKERECPICFKVFSCGRALGGHKRAHYYTTKIKEAMDVNEEIEGVRGYFDLNFPVSVDGVHSLWWAESESGHELA